MRYRTKPAIALAWKYDSNADLPVWVFRRCDKLGLDDVLTCVLSPIAPITAEARPGEWIVYFEEKGIITILPDSDFQAKFEPNP